MTQIYHSMTQALRDHWNANDKAYPQKFVLTPGAYQTLNAVRKLVNTTMANDELPGWENVFLDVPIEVGDSGNALIAADGTAIALQA